MHYLDKTLRDRLVLQSAPRDPARDEELFYASYGDRTRAWTALIERLAFRRPARDTGAKQAPGWRAREVAG